MHFSRYALFTTASVSAVLLSSTAYGLPQGGIVAAGNATIASSGTVAMVTQGSDRAVLDWSSFNIGRGEAVTFRQPSASSVTLNRIHGQRPSEIFGSLTANGQVILSNPNGILFGPSSRTDVAGLVATTANIGVDAFMRGAAWAFSSPGKPGASVTNEGTITARNAGLVALVAPLVVNEGFIGARLGRVQLAAADTFTLDLYGDGLLSLAADHAARIDNSGTLLARGGQVLLTAAQGEALLDSVINTTGVIDVSASRIDPSGIVVFGDGIGGNIALSARSIDVGSSSVLNASGPAGGGTIHIGGRRQGALLSLSGQALPNAGETTIAANSRLIANATAKGGGGTVIAWADGTTRFDGQIEAKGGPAGGNGGFVETSGRQVLGVTGTVDASAPKGKAGDWLLDPRNVTISGAGAYSVNPAGETVDPGADNFTILDSSISTALSNGNNVTITTGSSGAQAGDITLNGATISKTGGGDATLTLKADNSILTSGLNTISSSVGKLHTIFWADANVHSVATGGVIQLYDTTVSTNGGDLILAGGLDDGANGGTAADGRPDNYAWGNAGDPMGLSLSTAYLDSGTGNIRLLGHGQDNAGSNAHIGITIDWGSTITAHGAGAITAIGVAGTGIDYNYGLNIDGTNGSNVITAENGPITLIGTANGTGQFNHGLILYNGNTVASTGGGAIRMTGTAAATVNSTDIVTAVGANVIGDAGSGGDITFNADNLDMQQFSVDTPGSIAFQPRTLGRPINVAGGSGGLDLPTTVLDNLAAGEIIVGQAAGTGIVTLGAYAWDDPVRFVTGPAGSIAVSGAQTATAGSNATLTFAGPTTLNANLDLTNATGGTQAVVFNDAVTLGGNRTLALGAGDLSFNSALDGAFDLAVVTTGDVAFAANAGALTPLADVTFTGAHDVTGDSLFADSFTLSGGTGDVTFSTNSVHTAGNITIDTAGNITGGYHGQDGHLYSSGGVLSALVDFDTLDISGLSATLLPGRVGASGTADQAMANRISIDGLRDPWGPLIPNPAYRFNSYLIGFRGLADSGGQGGQGGNGQPPALPLPQEPRPPISGPSVPDRGFAVDFGNVPFPVAFAGIRANQVMISGELLLEDPYPSATDLFTDARDPAGLSSLDERSATEEQGW